MNTYRQKQEAIESFIRRGGDEATALLSILDETTMAIVVLRTRSTMSRDAVASSMSLTTYQVDQLHRKGIDRMIMAYTALPLLVAFEANPAWFRAHPEHIPLEKTSLSLRTYHTLKRAGIEKLEDILNLTKKEVGDIHLVGVSTLKEITDMLALYHRTL